MSLIAASLKALLVCPACKSELSEDEAQSRLVCSQCKRTYPVREFPIMLLEETDDTDDTQDSQSAGNLTDR